MKKTIAISVVILTMMAFGQGRTSAYEDYTGSMTTSVKSAGAQRQQAPLPETGAYLGAVDYKNATTSLFGCELKEVSYHYYRTADSAAKIVSSYQQRGFTVLRDDSVSTCCISKISYVLYGRQNGSTVYVTVENPWFDEKTSRFMGDTLIETATEQ